MTRCYVMRSVRLLCALLFCTVLRAQTPAPSTAKQDSAAQNPAAPAGPVPIRNEPHHRLVLQNDFVRVYSVLVPPRDATLLHQHDLPYIGVTLEASELVNAVVGKPEAHVTLQAGDTRYFGSPYAHLVRTDFGLPFHNITIEFLHPQGTARNLCRQVLQEPPGACPQPTAGSKKASETTDEDVPYFETDELRIDLITVTGGKDYVEEAPASNGLLIALSNANLNANLAGQHISFLHGGDILWLPAGAHRKVVDFLGTKSGFLLISFKDSGGGAKQ